MLVFQVVLYLNIQVASVMLPKTEPYYVWLASSRLSSPTSEESFRIHSPTGLKARFARLLLFSGHSFYSFACAKNINSIVIAL